ncbi:MAG: hypothetical protein ACRDRT_13770, partial [Pseudonocardiaceae bacterium]
DSADFVMKALSPARVKEVRIDELSGAAEVIVPDYQLSLAIGREGQNARLAARLTGWRVDIKSETQLAEEDAAYANEGWAEGEWLTDDSGELVWRPAEGGASVSAEQWSTPGQEVSVDQAPASYGEAVVDGEVGPVAPTDVAVAPADGAVQGSGGTE